MFIFLWKCLLITIWRVSQLFISENCVFTGANYFSGSNKHSMIYTIQNYMYCVPTCLLDQWTDNWFILHKQLGVWIMCWSGGFLLLSNPIVLHWHFVSASFEGLLPIHCLATSFSVILHADYTTIVFFCCCWKAMLTVI